MITIFYFLMVFIAVLSFLSATIPYIRYTSEVERIQLKSKRPSGW